MIRIVLLFCALVTPAAADPIDDAIAAWLTADDATAMPALAALAEAGDTRAMLFLGAIEPRPMVTPYMLTLDRKARNALLRQPGGLSGKSWLFAIPEGDAQRPLADAVLAARDGDPLPLLQLDQSGAAVQPLLRMFNEVPGALARASTEYTLSSTLDALVWADARLAPVVSPVTDAADRAIWTSVAARAEAAPAEGLHRLILAGFYLPDGAGPQAPIADQATGVILRAGTLLDMDNLATVRGIDAEIFGAATTRATAILMSAPEAAAHRALCAPCPDVPACTLAVWTASGAYFGAIFPGTPLDVLVPPEVYHGSPRQIAEIRHAAQAFPAQPASAACLSAD